VHVSELSDRRVRHPSDVVHEGDSVSVRILGVKPEERRISLSLREAERRPAPGEISVGTLVEGTVDRVERFGVFVRIGGGHRALLPAAESGTPPGADLAKAFPEASVHPLVVIAIDEQGRIKVSKRARDQAEERSLVDDFNRSQSTAGRGFGTLGDLLKKKTKT
jgi:small subunit ribosomal protein S1